MYVSRGQRSSRGYRMPRKRGKGNYNRGKKFARNLNGRSYDNDYSSDCGSTTSSFYSCRSGYSGARIRRNRSFGSCASYDSDGMSSLTSVSRMNNSVDRMSNLTSVSRMNNSVKENINPSNLAKVLSEFEDFQATLLQLLESLQIDHNSIKKVALDNDSTFEVDGELILLRPKVSVCSFHLAKGCDQKEGCNNIHLCSDYIMGLCRERDCYLGHFWCTDHNKRVFTYYHLNFLNVKVLSSLFKMFLSSKSGSKDLEVCEQYNEGNCDISDCHKLHLCIKFVAGRCSSGKCSLNHKVLSSEVKNILQSFGISLNETPRDILFSIMKSPKIQKVVEKFKSGRNEKDSSSEKQPEEITSSEKKKGETTSALSVKTKEEEKKVEKPLPIKTVWSSELRGDVTIDEICYNSVEDYCPYEEKGCWRLHCPYHFHWQIKTTLGKKQSWVNLTVEQSLALEKAFCDVNVSKVSLPILDPSASHSFDKGLLLILKGKSKWEADFDTMTLNLTDKNVTLELRRLCTETTENKRPDPCKFKWYFSDISKNWIEYGNIDSTGNENLKCNLSSKDIENHLQTRPNSPLPFQNQSYTYILDVQNMVQMNLDTNARRNIRRRPIPHLKEETDDDVSGDLPSHWESMQQDERCRRVTLLPSSEEYKKIDTLFKSQGASQNILKIERVQNPYVYRAFQNKVQEMKVTYKNDSSVNIRQLFHGTTPDIVPKICDENFDWRLHGTSSGQSYGRGTYFSTLSSYSQGYARADSNGHSFMFVAKVAVGTVTTGNSGMARPPINTQYNLPFDSTVDNVSNPTIIVKYDKQEYYPEYIITFG